MTIESVQQGTGSDGRYLRAIDLFWDAAFERTSKSPEVWVVETSYGSINEVETDRGTCSCRDYEINSRGGNTPNFYCKHKWAVNMKRVWLRQNVREIVEAGYFGDAA